MKFFWHDSGPHPQWVYEILEQLAQNRARYDFLESCQWWEWGIFVGICFTPVDTAPLEMENDMESYHANMHLRIILALSSQHFPPQHYHHPSFGQFTYRLTIKCPQKYTMHPWLLLSDKYISTGKTGKKVIAKLWFIVESSC